QDVPDIISLSARAKASASVSELERVSKTTPMSILPPEYHVVTSLCLINCVSLILIISPPKVTSYVVTEESFPCHQDLSQSYPCQPVNHPSQSYVRVPYQVCVSVQTHASSSPTSEHRP